jgi:hypothetical protein
MYSAMLLMRSHSLYFKLSGAASAGIFVLPILLALVAYWRHGGFEPDAGLHNGDEPGPQEIPPAAVPDAPVSDHSLLGKRARLIALAVFAAGLCTLLIPGLGHFGEAPTFKITAEQAQASSDAYLRALGADPGAFLHVTYPNTHWGGDESLAAKYFLEHGPIGAAARLFERYRPAQFWETRYFKSLDKEEYDVAVQPETGKVLSFHHEIPEDRPGADLSADDARHIAEHFAAAHGVDVAGMDLKENDSDKRKARRDYTLVWEARPGDPRNVGEVRYRAVIEVNGDHVDSLYFHWKIPEGFERSRARQNFVSIAILVVKISVIAAGMVFGLWLLIRQIRLGLVPWGRSLRWAILPTAMTAVTLALSLHVTLYRAYQTSIPFQTFAVTTCVALAMGVAFAFVMYAALAALLLSFFPDTGHVLNLAKRRLLGLDALFLMLMAIGLWLLTHQFGAFLTSQLHELAIPNVDSPTLIGTALPGLSAVAGALRSVFSLAGMVAVVALAVRKLPQPWMLPLLLLLAVCASISDEVRTLSEFGLAYGVEFVRLASALAFCLWFARNNYLAYLLLFLLNGLYPAMAELFLSGNQALQMQSWAVATLLAAGVACSVLPGLRRKTTAGPS